MIRLYMMEGCPYCLKVRQAVSKLKLVEGKDFQYVPAGRGDKGRLEVIQMGGMSQVPFMVDGKIQMYESEDIIAYLEKKFSKQHSPFKK